MKYITKYIEIFYILSSNQTEFNQKNCKSNQENDDYWIIF
jgi:hypothetical protein